MPAAISIWTVWLWSLNVDQVVVGVVICCCFMFMMSYYDKLMYTCTYVGLWLFYLQCIHMVPKFHAGRKAKFLIVRTGLNFRVHFRTCDWKCTGNCTFAGIMKFLRNFFQCIIQHYRDFHFWMKPSFLCHIISNLVGLYQISCVSLHSKLPWCIWASSCGFQRFSNFSGCWLYLLFYLSFQQPVFLLLPGG